jgi:hypothetical protein
MASRRSSWAQAIGLARERGSKIEQGLQHSHTAVCSLSRQLALAAWFVPDTLAGARRGEADAGRPSRDPFPLPLTSGAPATILAMEMTTRARPTDGHPGENAQVLVKRALADRARKR